MTNQRHTVLYTGVTNNIVRRVFEHRQNLTSTFAARYNVSKLVWFESTMDVRAAIAREK
jgi:putative endonuclease